MSGRFARVSDTSVLTLRMTHFDVAKFGPAEDESRGNGYHYGHYYADRHAEVGETTVPEGVGIHVTLPDDQAVLPSGRERFERPQPFYGRVIAHSPSFDI